MIDLLIQLVIYLVVAGLIWYLVTVVLGMLPIPEPIKQIINVVMLIILVLIVLYALLPLLHLGGAHSLR